MRILVNSFVYLSGIARWAFKPVTCRKDARKLHSGIAIRAEVGIFRQWFCVGFLFKLFQGGWKFQPGQHISPNFLNNKIVNLSGNNGHLTSLKGLFVRGLWRSSAAALLPSLVVESLSFVKFKVEAA